ncbi:hypothetical protein DID88_001340 [Monilinia fructigena]|uniref:GCVT N-terminal domain-containing protein n=1 Tax=Monilinia fructigena TaxID=38457 RepID=A0A395IZF4_9HELO|nr:hypothetical protein DID88_001340 [Monilinia fructigena]
MRRFKAVTGICDTVLINSTGSRCSRQLSTALQRRNPTASSLLSFKTGSRFPTSARAPSQQQLTRHASSSSPSSSELRKTPLYDLHLANGGKMVPFGGFHMPVQYSGLSVSASHHFTREHASLSILGSELFYVVTNAGCREKDLKYLGEELEAFAKEEEGRRLDGRYLMLGIGRAAGPESESILEGVLAEEMKEGMFQGFLVCLLVSRGGYTGEDGFEISIPENETVAVTQALLQSAGEKKLQLAGLGARDSLRLEAGMCLYGHDLDDTTTPVEAGLGWVVGKERRTEGGFHGAEVILKQIIQRVKVEVE